MKKTQARRRKTSPSPKRNPKRKTFERKNSQIAKNKHK
jgi:hypothetical protein